MHNAHADAPPHPVTAIRAWARKWVTVCGAGLHDRGDVMQSLAASLGVYASATRSAWMIAVRAKIIETDPTNPRLVRVRP